MLSIKIRGVLVVHACFSLSRAALAERLNRFDLEVEAWQPLGQYSATSLDLDLDYQSSMDLVDALSKVAKLRFEIVLWPSEGFTGERWVWSPALGLSSCQIDAAGNTLIGEAKLSSILRESGDNALKIERLIRQAMLKAWDEEFEDLREQRISQRRQLPRVG
mgnify:CR=1 FL=1